MPRPKRSRSKKRSKGFLYPGTRYLGPGNPTHNGRPTSATDALARKHDIQYGYLQKQGVNPYFTWNTADVQALKRAKATTKQGAVLKAAMLARKILPTNTMPVPNVKEYGAPGPVMFWANTRRR